MSLSSSRRPVRTRVPGALDRSPRLRIALVSALVVCFASGAGAQGRGSTSAPEGFEPIVVGGATTLVSTVLDEERSVFVSLPAGYEASSDRYPVIYLLDGRSNFNHVVGSTQIESADGRIPPVIVVGINNTQRTRDLTPVWRGAEDDEGRPGRFGEFGGAERFREFLVDELRPWIESRYRTVPYSVLVGHSFGGLFSIDTWIEEPSAFDAYVAIAPSLWWDRVRLVDEVEALDSKVNRPPLYTTMGDEREEMSQAYREFEQAILQQSLRAGGSAPSRVAVEHRPGESHGTLVLDGMREGLRHAFPLWRLSDRVRRSGDLAALDAHYARLSAIYGFELTPGERVLNLQGYRLMAREEAERAIEIFEAVVERFPDSPNAYDSLGEARRDTGDLAAARRLFGEAVRRAEAVGHPSLEVYREHLEAVSPQ